MNLFNSLITVKNFNLFSEYFLGISVLYVLIVTILICYNVLGLIIEHSISNCIGLILFFACYLILNEDFLFCEYILNFYDLLGFYKSVIIDNFGFFAKVILCFFLGVYFLVVSDFLKNYKLSSFEYLLLLLLAVIGLLFLCMSNNLLSAYLAIELISLSSYLLAGFKKNSSYSIEAGIKYLIIGSISSSFFLLGSSFLYASLGVISFTEWGFFFFDLSWVEIKYFSFKNVLLNTLKNYKESILVAVFFKTAININHFIITECFEYLEIFIEIGLMFIVCSLFIKLALAPFHVWALDVYEGSPLISTFFFSVFTKLSIFILLTRICYSLIYFKEFWQCYSVIVSFLSIFVGSFGGLRQKKLKTLLAYSSISHVGYTLLSFSTGTQFGLEMFFFYLVVYMFSGIIIWFIILFINENQKYYFNKFNKELGSFVLLKKANPALAISFSVAMFSVAGIPPLIGFFAKTGVFLSLLNLEYFILALLIILCSIISTFYYIRIIKIIYFENVLVGQLYYPVKTHKVLVITTFVFILFFLFINPTLFYIFIYKSVWQSFYYF